MYIYIYIELYRYVYIHIHTYISLPFVMLKSPSTCRPGRPGRHRTSLGAALCRPGTLVLPRISSGTVWDGVLGMCLICSMEKTYHNWGFNII